MKKEEIILGLQQLINSIRTYESVHEASEVKIGDAISFNIPLTPDAARAKLEELRNEAVRTGVDMNDPEIAELINAVRAQVELSKNNAINVKGNTITSDRLTGMEEKGNDNER